MCGDPTQTDPPDQGRSDMMSRNALFAAFLHREVVV
jgi:hypothetical protein